MATPTYVTGQVLGASDVNNWLVPDAVYKTATTNRSTLTISIDPDLQLALSASSIYEVKCSIIYQSTNTCRFAWTTPASATGGFTAGFNLAGTGAGTWGFGWGSSNDAAGLAGSVNGIQIHGFIQTAGSGGTFGVNWGSGAGPASLTLGVGSALVVQRIG